MNINDDNEIMQLNVFDVISTDAAISTDDGDKVFVQIDEYFQQGYNVELDFSHINRLISAFLNAAIGQLYSKYDSDFLNLHLKIKGLPPEDIVLLRKVIERAKEYFLNKTKFENDVNDVIGDE